MRKVTAYVSILVVVFVAGLVLGQQKYPNLPDYPVVLDNDKVVVQKMNFEPGKWSGVHKHAGGQLVVIVEPVKMLYKEGGKDVEKSFKAGDVFWVDAVEHDHKAESKGTAILVSLK